MSRKTTAFLLLLMLPLLWGFFRVLPAARPTALSAQSSPVPDVYRVCFVQLGAFGDMESAQAFASQMRQQGQAGYILQGAVYRCLGTAFSSLDQAQEACRSLSDLPGAAACVYQAAFSHPDSQAHSRHAAICQCALLLMRAADRLESGAIDALQARHVFLSALASLRCAGLPLPSAAPPLFSPSEMRLCACRWILDE